MNKINPFIFISSLSLMIFFIIQFSPGLFPLMEPDSYDYLKIANSHIRTAIYPGINELFDFLNINIIHFQMIFLSISISLLIFSLFRKLNNLTLLIFIFFLITFNYYYTSFSKTILSESFFFSFINITVSIIILVKNFKKGHFILLGLLMGLIITIKPIGSTFAIPIISGVLFKLTNEVRHKLVFIFSIIIVIFIENLFFYSNHEKRSSVLPVAMTGKIFMISGQDDFNYKFFPNEYHNLIKDVQIRSKEVNNFLNSINNPLLKIDLAADYEAVFQTQIRKQLVNIKDKTFNKFQNDMNNFYICLRNNLNNYVTISLSHYIGQWLTGPKYIFMNNNRFKNESEIPLYNNLLLSSSKFTKPKNFQLYASLLFFLFLFITFTFISVISIYQDWKEKKFSFNSLLIISIQTYLIATSFINIASIRYLMPMYPVIIIVIILFLNEKLIKYKQKKYLENKF